LNWKGWLVAAGLVLVLGWIALANGFLMHGD